MNIRDYRNSNNFNSIYYYLSFELLSFIRDEIKQKIIKQLKILKKIRIHYFKNSQFNY